MGELFARSFFLPYDVFLRNSQRSFSCKDIGQIEANRINTKVKIKNLFGFFILGYKKRKLATKQG
jgi:hypothetical protein